MPNLRIGIDARLAGSKHGGIGRYIENLIHQLPRLTDNVTWVVFFHDQQQADQVLAGVSVEHRRQFEVVLAPVRHYTIAEQLQMPGIFQRAQLDLLHVPHFNIALGYRGKLVITIHDLLWHEQQGIGVTTLPAAYYWLKHWVYGWVVKAAVQRAAKILVPAETIKKTIIKFYPNVAKKIVVTPEGIGEAFAQELKKQSLPATKEINQKLAAKTLVYVGSLYPHKNVQVVLSALQHLPDWQLILVGSRSVFQEGTLALAQQLGVAAQVTWKGYVPDVGLIPLLQESTALIQPSLSEGFGLTGVEAMACGVPVLASDIPIFHEVYQDGAVYFAPEKSSELLTAIQSLNEKIVSQKIAAGVKVARQYDWQKMAVKTVDVYKSSTVKATDKSL